MRMDDAVIDLHRFLATFNTIEIEHMISNNTIMVVGEQVIPYLSDK